MYLICRNGSTPLNVICQAECKEFVTHYLKYNVDGDKRNLPVIYDAKEVPLENFDLDPLPEMPSDKQKTKKTADAGIK